MTTSRPAVLFDLDGTLIDSIELILNSARYAFGKLERAWISDDAWLAGIGTPLSAMFSPHARDAADVDRFIAAYREYQLEHHDRLVRCYDEVADTIDELRRRGHMLAIVTSKTEALASRGLAHVGIRDRFETIVGCDASSRHKPDPEPVVLALTRLGVTASNAVFVGDSVHDMEAGNAAGVTTIAALWGPFSRERLAPSRPSHYLERISELPGLVQRLAVPRD